MNSRALKRWRIPNRFRVRELKAFAWQYNEWIAALEELPEISAVDNDGMPHGTSISDPVARLAGLREVYQMKVGMVDHCLSHCCGDDSLRKAVRKSVTSPGGLTYAWLKTNGYLHHERDTYYEAVQKFYWILDQLKI